MASILDRSRHLWFQHKTAVWALGEVTKNDDKSDSVSLLYKGEVFIVKKSATEEFDPTHLENHNDVATLNNLNAAPLLDLLRRRYFGDEIYTNVSNISISFNPYKWISKLYDEPESEKYTKERIPHVYSVASMTHELMLKNKKDQSVIVSGESGAGKTEACKKVMKFLAEHSSGGASGKSSGHITVEDKVIMCNPFLEAFGNAKTVRNDNSSRFGKFIKIEYSHGKISGASMCHYLLEKSRVVKSSAGERNYHIFYQLCAGAPAKLKQALHLQSAKDYKILNQGAMTVDNVDDAAEFKMVVDSLLAVGATQQQLDSMFELLAGIMHLGNVEFDVDKEENALISEATKAGPLKCAMELLHCSILDVKLTSRVVKAKGRSSVYTVPLKLFQAQEARDALAKAIYDNMFTYLIELCNESLAAAGGCDQFIGILDIFGFEIFQKNAFEQLCINFANEKLQSLFNHTVFIAEQEMYKSEGIDCAYIEFQNNQSCVDLIEKKPNGLLPILDELCMLGRATDTDLTYLAQINTAHRGKSKDFGISRFGGDNVFVVKHFAGEVVYCVDGFMSKNSDKLLSDLEEAMQMSKSDFIRRIFDPQAGASTSGRNARAGSATSSGVVNAGKAPTTIGFKFKNQLGNLYNDILATSPHYIRCVKPNNNKKAAEFDAVMVMEQLKCNGTLEMVRIRREGYPMRERWHDLWQVVLKYQYWKYARVDVKSKPEIGCPAVFKKALPPGHFQVAKSGLVFLKFDTYDVLQKWKQTINAKLIQTRFRCWWRRKWYKVLKRRIIKLQRCIGGFMARMKYRVFVVQITRIQAFIRRVVCVTRVIKRKKAAKLLNSRIYSYVTAKQDRKRFLSQKESIKIIQSTMRGMAARRVYKGMRYEKFVVQEDIKRNLMASTICRLARRNHLSKKIETWTQEAFGAASWGDVELLKNLLNCTSPEFKILASMKKDLPDVRDRVDGMKTMLHVACINGNADAVKLLIQSGASIDVVDSFGNTPLIRSSGSGDSHIETTKLLVKHCKNITKMVNRVNKEEHSALDAALAEGAESSDGSSETTKVLLSCGAESGKGHGKAAVEKLVQKKEMEKQEKDERENRLQQEKLAAARKERELDPHFQFMKLQDNVGDVKQDAVKKERERKAQLEEQEKLQRQKAEEEQKKRIDRRASARPSLFAGKGKSLLGGGMSAFLEEEVDEEDGKVAVTAASPIKGVTQGEALVASPSATLAGRRTSNMTAAVAAAVPVAESKSESEPKISPTGPMKRRVSSKATDNSWAVKSNVPYKSLIGTKAGAEDADGAESKSAPSSRPGSGRSSLDSSMVMEDDEEREEAPAASFPVSSSGKRVGAVATLAAEAVSARSTSEGTKSSAPQEPSTDAGTIVNEPPPRKSATVTPQLTTVTADSHILEMLILTQCLQDMATPTERKGWYYLNHEGGEEGPFAADWMHSWLADRALNKDTQIRFGHGHNFVSLSSLIPSCDTITQDSPNPFALDVANAVKRVRAMLEKIPIV